MKFIELNSEQKIQFKKNYDIYFNNLEMDYLKKVRVFGAYKNNILCGGYIINVGVNNSRYIAAIGSEEQKKTVLSVIGNHYCEIACVWRDKEKLKSIYERILFFLHMLMAAYKTKQDFIVGGTINLKLKSLQLDFGQTHQQRTNCTV